MADSERIRAVIFDMDGVLVDSWPMVQEGLEIACYKITGKPAPLEEFRALMGLPLGAILDHLHLPQSIAPLFHELSMASSHKVTCYNGIIDLLSFCRSAKIKVGVVTGKARLRAVDIFHHTGLGTYIDCLITPDDAPGKPDPRDRKSVV